MNENFVISDEGLDLIKSYEGLELKAYQCSADVWTIGYGHTHNVKRGDRIDAATAIEFLRGDVRHAQRAIYRLVAVELNQGQFDALVSFIYNLGAGAFGRSTLLKRINKKRWAAAADQFRLWNKATVDGKLTVLRGLVRRRAAEAEMFANVKDVGMTGVVDEPKVKTMLNSKTNGVSIIGAGGLCVSQLEGASKIIDKVNEVTAKGGDLAAKVGAVVDSITLPMVVIGVVICIFGYVIYERRRKVVEHGI